MRRMLDPKEAGGSLPSTVKFDAEGNRTVGKDLGVDGKLKLKSLVSASNPDGDITKELGGGGGGGGAKIYRHSLSILQSTANDKSQAYFTYYTTSSTKFTLSTLKNICPEGKTYECSGYYEGQRGKGPIISLKGGKNFPSLCFKNISLSSFQIESEIIDDYRFILNDEVSEVN